MNPNFETLKNKSKITLNFKDENSLYSNLFEYLNKSHDHLVKIKRIFV